MTRSLRRFRSLQNDTAGAVLLYSGDEVLTVDGIKIVPYAATASLLFNRA